MNSRMETFTHRVGGLAFGGDYNPEQWDPARLAGGRPRSCARPASTP